MIQKRDSQNSDSQKPDTEKPDTEKPGSQNPGSGNDETPFLALARTHRIEDASAASRLILDTDPSVQEFAASLHQIANARHDELSDRLGDCVRGLPAPLVEVCVLLCWQRHATAWTQQDVESLQSTLAGWEHPTPRCAEWLLAARRAQLHVETPEQDLSRPAPDRAQADRAVAEETKPEQGGSGAARRSDARSRRKVAPSRPHRQAETQVAEAIDALEAQDAGVIRDYCLSVLLQVLGQIREIQRRASGARDALARSLQIEQRRGFGGRWCAAVHLARLLRARGQYADALAVLTTDELRTSALQEERLPELSTLHFETVRTALAMSDGPLAFQEVMAADEILTSEENGSPPARSPWIDGQLLLSSGLVELQLDNHDEAEDLLRAAASELSGAGDPVAALEAWIELAEGAFRTDRARRIYDEIEHVIRQCDGPYTAATVSALIALETFRFAGDFPPPTERYRELLRLAQRIIPPVLRFRSLTNLYQYAIGFLDQYDQAALLMRIRALSEEIDSEAFPALYDQWVTKRYQYAIEARLDRRSRMDQ